MKKFFLRKVSKVIILGKLKLVLFQFLSETCMSQSTTDMNQGVDGWFLGWTPAVADILRIGHYANQPIIFFTKDQERMRVTKEYVVIGAKTASPSSQLEVVQTAGNTAVYTLNTGSSGSNTSTALWCESSQGSLSTNGAITKCLTPSMAQNIGLYGYASGAANNYGVMGQSLRLIIFN